MAAEDALAAQILLAAAKAAEADANTLERAVLSACVTAEGLPGHLAAVVGKDNVVTWRCVPNGQ